MPVHMATHIPSGGASRQKDDHHNHHAKVMVSLVAPAHVNQVSCLQRAFDAHCIALTCGSAGSHRSPPLPSNIAEP
jgi:hypothetical protein